MLRPLIACAKRHPGDPTQHMIFLLLIIILLIFGTRESIKIMSKIRIMNATKRPYAASHRRESSPDCNSIVSMPFNVSSSRSRISATSAPSITR
jgi:hypothetical protein